MKNNFSIKNIFIIVLSIIILFSSCNSSNAIINLKQNQFLDAANNVITIPTDKKNATVASVYAVSVPFFSALKMTDRVKAINVKQKFWKDVDENLENADTVGKGVVDLEKLAKINPSCLVHRSNDKMTVDAVKKLGIDVICIKVENLDDVKRTLNDLSKYFGNEDEAEKVISWIDDKFLYIENIVKNIPKDQKKTALLMGGTLGRVAGNDMLQNFMLEKAGAKVVVKEAKDHNWIDIGVERVFEYNPDFLFMTSSTALDYTKDELLNSNTWSEVSAVKNKKLYQIPAKYDSWDMPGISCTLGTMYMLYKMYPEYFSKEEFKKQISEYYIMMFNRDFDEDFLGYNLD